MSVKLPPMEHVELRTQSPHRLRLFVIGYTVFFVAVICLVAFGPEEVRVAFGALSGWARGIFGAALCLIPLLLLKPLTYVRVTAKLAPDKLTLVTDKQESIIDLDRIHIIVLEKGNTLSFYDERRNLLFSLFDPPQGAGLEKLVKNFTKLPDFHKETKQVKVAGRRRETVFLTRK
jgi:hypothetical protein